MSHAASARRLVKLVGLKRIGALVLVAALLALLRAPSFGAQTDSQITTYGPGTFAVPTTQLVSGGVLRGAGPGVTVLQGNVVTAGFAALTGTDSPGGAAEFTIADITIEGNVQIYGYGFTLQNVTIRGCLYSEWSSSAASPGGDSMEATISGLKVSGCNGAGITWNGPHDSLFTNVVTFLNGGPGLRIGSNGGSQFNTFHAWGNVSPAVDIGGAGSVFTNAQFEGVAGPQVRILANDVEITGAQVYGAGVGVQLGDATHSVGGTYLQYKATNVSPALVLEGDAGSTWAQILAWQASGPSLFTGTVGPNTVIQGQTVGSAAGSVRVPVDLGK